MQPEPGRRSGSSGRYGGNESVTPRILLYGPSKDFRNLQENKRTKRYVSAFKRPIRTRTNNLILIALLKLVIIYRLSSLVISDG